jgi:hypothetical protein
MKMLLCTCAMISMYRVLHMAEETDNYGGISICSYENSMKEYTQFFWKEEDSSFCSRLF